MSGAPKEFRQAVIPAELAVEVVAVIQAHPELGHRTLSDFVRAATVDRLRVVEAHLALRALRATSELGADAVEALIRDSLPPEYRSLLSGRYSTPP